MQRYVSKELVHFVGKAKLSDRERYDCFKKIFSGHKLGTAANGTRSLSYTSSEKLSSNEVYTPSMVCFSDIPFTDLGIHMRKYSPSGSPFGISFLKSYLINKGVMPVWYISKNSKHYSSGLNDNETYGDWHDMVFEEFKELSDRRENKDQELKDLFHYLEWYIFSQMKFFDSEKDESNKENYYMEREWRILGALDFEGIKNVYRVILPPKYVEQFKKDFPAYCGQISFAEI